MDDNYFILNKETGKLELHFEKSTYDALTAEQKASIKSNFLWGRRSGCWISRAKEPNLYWARKTAKEIGLEDAGATGERLSFAEQQARKQERAERRADRYDGYADAAEKNAEQLQAPINAMREKGDTAFFTQPNIDSAAGRAFARRRERMFAAYERGFDEFRRSEYWKERAATARVTAENKGMQDKGFIQRRIAERESSIRKVGGRIKEYGGYIESLDAGETPRNKYGWTVGTPREKLQEQIDADTDRLEVLLDELGYYQEALETLGGVTFGRGNLTKGDLIYISRWKEPVRFVRGGPKNFTYEFTVPHMKYADGQPMQGQAAYAEITGRMQKESPEEAGAMTPEEFAARAAGE